MFVSIMVTNRSTVHAQETVPLKQVDQTIFAYGGPVNRTFINYIITLTGKPRPKICFIPTANADWAYDIIDWYDLCHDLSVEPHVLYVWVSSYYTKKSFDETLLSMDTIIVGGGNTLNMIGIWKAQGIDTILLDALNKGTILAGSSAGSLCWFEKGITDSRPKELSVIDGLGFLKYSNCPHYSSEQGRKEIYEKEIMEGKIMPGYACQDSSGVLFKNGNYVKSISLDSMNNSYYISVKNDEVEIEKLVSEIIK